ncbi:MAG: hypothetical protein ING29_10580 [Azospirillum sp.]|nr:hypothetical protein [Azospirillum sp.]
MLRKRIVALLPLRGGLVVQSFGFARHLPVGRLDIAVDFLDEWGVDEIVAVDIDAGNSGQIADLRAVERAARKCRVPFAVGGGVSTVEGARRLLASGADKVVVRTAVAANPAFAGELGEHFGDQCVVAAVDLAPDEAGVHRLVPTPGSILPPDPLAAIAALKRSGAGEVLLQNRKADGSRAGLEFPFLDGAPDPGLPVIVASGAGRPEHVAAMLRLRAVAAVAIGNLLSHTEHSVTHVKSFLRRAGCDVRLDTNFDYAAVDADAAGRPLPARPKAPAR